jgi:hypothetical protein
LNDPAPDLMEVTLDGRYIMVAFLFQLLTQPKAPAEVLNFWIVVRQDVWLKSFVQVIPSRILLFVTASGGGGGVQYAGLERANVHGIFVVPK